MKKRFDYTLIVPIFKSSTLVLLFLGIIGSAEPIEDEKQSWKKNISTASTARKTEQLDSKPEVYSLSSDRHLAEIRHTVEALRSDHAAENWLNPPWSKEMKNAFWQRAYGYFQQFDSSYQVETKNDDEKHTYAELMATAIAGDRQRAIKLEFHQDLSGIQIGQNRNLLIWLQPNENKPVFFQIPQTVKPEFSEITESLARERGLQGAELVSAHSPSSNSRARLTHNVWFFAFERIYIAVRPINLKPPASITLDQPTCLSRCSKYYYQETV